MRLPLKRRVIFTFLTLLISIVFTVAPGLASAQTERTAISAQVSVSVMELSVFPVAGIMHLEWTTNPESNLLAVATVFGVYLYNIDEVLTGTFLPVLVGNDSSPAQDLAFSPNGQLLAAASGTVVRIYDMATNRETFVLQGTSPIAFSPTGSDLIYTAGSDLRIYDVTQRRDRAMLHGHTERINDVVYSADGGLIASASQDATLRYWSAATGDQLGFSRSRRNPITTMSVSPNGALIASGTRSGTLRLLNLAVDTERTHSPNGHRSAISSVDFNNDGSLLMYTVQNTIHLWDMDAESDPTIFADHTAEIVQAQFNAAGTLFASIGRDDVVRIYGI